jgi:LacI family transcriptional regulator
MIISTNYGELPLPNIYDVAKRAKVSVATVSAVINKTSYVSPQLRKQVERAIAALNYSPNLLARSLAQQKTHTIGILIPDVANPFFPEIVRGAEDEASKANYTVILGNSDNQVTKEDLYLNLFLSKRVDGILFVKGAGDLNPALLENLKRVGPPVVLVDREYSGLHADTVVADDYGGAFAATHHLLELGHRRIGIIVGIAGTSTTNGRTRGYVEALERADVELSELLVAKGDYGIESGYKEGLRLLDERPSAVFVTNCMMTIGFFRALEERGLRCPEDISVVSYDDFFWNDLFHPKLTCVEQPKYQLGRRSTQILLSRIAGKHKRPKYEVLKNELRIRESSAPFRG